jgi:hypothetical protein
MLVEAKYAFAFDVSLVDSTNEFICLQLILNRIDNKNIIRWQISSLAWDKDPIVKVI